MPTKIYFNLETSATWSETGGDHTLTLSSLAAGAVRIGDTRDFGSTSHSRLYEWRLHVSGFESSDTPVLGEGIDAFLSYSQDQILADGSGATTDGDRLGSSDYIPNYDYLGTILTMSTDPTGVPLTKSGFVEINSRYAAPIIRNNTTADTIQSNVNHYFILTPVPDEVQ